MVGSTLHDRITGSACYISIIISITYCFFIGDLETLRSMSGAVLMYLVYELSHRPRVLTSKSEMPQRATVVGTLMWKLCRA